MARLPQAPLIRTATVTLVVAFALLAVSFVRAIRITPVEAATNTATSELARITTTPPAPDIDLDAVGANGIFQPDRNPMPYRYRMPGDPAPNDAGAPAPILPVVLGTVLSTDGAHFATCQMPGGRPTVVRVGDKLGEYTVIAIDRDKVAFKNAAGKTIEITVTRPGT
jgi:type IV pilus biogenesis protein PilP